MRYEMTPVQRRTFTELLAIGGPRPTTPPGLVEELHETILTGTREAVANWTKSSLFLTKGQLFTALKCEGQLVADAEQPRTAGLHMATAVGIVAHRAIQIAHTHPDEDDQDQGASEQRASEQRARPRKPVDDYVRAAVKAAAQESGFGEFWHSADLARQSDLLQQASGKVATFLSSWPALDKTWTPLFEVPLQAKVGRLTLSARADLVLGQPRADRRQSMLIADLKSGTLHEDRHYDEAMFYALIATLRNEVPPFRSTVYSLASATYTDPDVTAEALRAIAGKVVVGTVALVETLTARRLPVLTAGDHCTWCPVMSTCPAAQQLNAA